MSYRTQAILAQDNKLMTRAIACAATQGIMNPDSWVWAHQWVLSSEPGWDAAYSYALNAKNDSPGDDEAVISDGMILSAVQAIMAAPPVAPPL